MQAKNLILVMSDEHDPRLAGHEGHSLVKTPNLDRLAARGTRFESAYTPCPICVPARASFATGRYVHELRKWDNAMGYEGAVRGWTHSLQDAGIRVDSIGKLHYRKQEDPLGFDHQYEPMHIMDGIGMVWGSIRHPFPDLPERWSMFKKIGPGVSNYNLYDRRIANTACQWLMDRDGEGSDAEPWVLYVGFVAPHFPLVVPKQYYDLYPLDDLTLPKLLPRDGHAHHPWIRAQEAFMAQDDLFQDDEQRLMGIAAYYGLCTFVDAQIGMILDLLDQTGQADSTRVIYTSDHGDNLGARGLWGKSNLYEECVRAPMIVAGPDVPAGVVKKTPANLLDLASTVLDGAGLADDDPALRGRSLYKLIDEADDPERVMFSEYHAIGADGGAFMVRRGRYKFHYYVGYAPELFDLENDPAEAHDLAGDPDHAAVVAEMEAELRRIVDPEVADRQAREDQAALIATFGGRERALAVGTPGATPVPGHGSE